MKTSPKDKEMKEELKCHCSGKPYKEFCVFHHSECKFYESKNYVDSRTDAERESDSKIEVTVTTATSFNKPTTLTTIQTIKETEERLENKYGETFSENGLKIVQSHITQTLLAVFESELEEIGEDFAYDPDDEVSSWEFQKLGINLEKANRRSHLTEVINYLKQK